jgi:pimeloyl-ACP methyl ester carboxylesterase
MRTARCRICGERVRRDRLDSHMRAVHRKGRELEIVPLAAAIAAIVAVTVVAIWLMRQTDQPEENGTGPVDPGAESVQFNTDDGWIIRGSYHRGNQSMPVVVLVPGVGEGRQAFGPLKDELLARGYNVLAYDSRGAGQSVFQDGRKRVWQDLTDADFQAGTKDVASAWQYARAKFLNAPYVAVIGASLGANQALASTAADTAPELKALVLLSAGSEYRGIASRPAIETLNNRTVRPSIFFAASQGEPSAGPVAQSLNQSYAGKKSLELLTGGGHGTTLLTYPGFRTQIVQFLDDAFRR